ncbi:MAG: helix-turn-helix transcriptional regulator [Microbacteriaceae bacterium]|nr:helix-turn-helix transcriptional regulator [Microbacteriaceae bacterium]
MRESLGTSLSNLVPGASLMHPASYFGARVTSGVSSYDLERLKVVLIQSGRAELLGDFGIVSVGAGDLVLIPPRVEYGGIITEPGSLIGGAFDLMFVLDQIKLALHDTSPGRRQALAHFRTITPTVRRLRPNHASWRELERVVSGLLRSAPEMHMADHVVGATQFLWKVGALVDPLVAQGNVLRDFAIRRPISIEMRKAVDLLQHDLAHPWTVAELAAAVFTSPSKLHRDFKSALGMGPKEYHVILRAARYELLATMTDLDFAQVSAMVGWLSPDHARRTFRTIYGSSPRDHRARARADQVEPQLPDVWTPREGVG